jgi:putative tryptophan/tyrosine transport system substrate-binding protein
MFINSVNPLHTTSLQQARAAAQALRITLQVLDVRASENLDGAFAAILKERPEALLILADRVFLHNRAGMMDFATQRRLPNVNAYRELVEAAG